MSINNKARAVSASKKLNLEARNFVVANMNVSNNYQYRKKAQKAEERKRMEKVKKSAQKRKNLAALKDEKDGEKVKKKEKKVRKV